MIELFCSPGVMILTVLLSLIMGYTWTTKVDNIDTILAAHINLLQTEKVDRDGAVEMTGTFQEDKGADVASATTMALGTDGNYYDITGTTTIVTITHAQAQPGTRVVLHFAGILILTHSATDLILPSAANITTAAGDVMMLENIDTSKWRCISYMRADGTPVVGGELIDDTTPQLGGTLDTNAHQVRWAKGSDVASANALVLGTDGNYFDITGITAITSIGTLAVGTVVRLHFDGILTLTHHATNLILPGAANITTAAGDEFTFVEYASGDWRCTAYALASGESVVSGGSVSPRTSTEKTNSYTVQTSDGGTTFTMNAAAVAKVFTLPAASAAGRGFWFTGVKGQAGDLSFSPNGTDTIGRFGNTDVENDDANEAGWAFLTLEVNYDEDGWIVHGDGTWHT